MTGGEGSRTLMGAIQIDLTHNRYKQLQQALSYPDCKLCMAAQVVVT